MTANASYILIICVANIFSTKLYLYTTIYNHENYYTYTYHQTFAYLTIFNLP
jgi:hypothetical protein